MKTEDLKFVNGLRERLNNELKRLDYPSFAIGILKENEVLMAEGIGFRDVENQLAADKNTVYNSASCGKAYTVALVDMLVDQGKLTWDEPVANYCPELVFADSYVTANVTMRDLLCHRTGLPRHDYAWASTHFSKADIVLNMRFYELNKSFRSTFQYSNICYMIAGYIIEKMTGMTYERCLETMIFEPLGMKHPAIFSSDISCEVNRALPYERPGNPYAMKGMKRSQECPSPAEDCEKRIGDAGNPAGCVNIDVEDSLKWLGFWLNKGKVGNRQLVREATVEENFYPNIIVTGPTEICSDYNYGMGWFAGTYRGQKFYEHGGNVEGFTTLTFLWPEKRIGLIFFNNFTGTYVGRAVMYSIIDHELGSSRKDWFDHYYTRQKEYFEKYSNDLLNIWRDAGILGKKVEGTLPSHSLSSYCGCYETRGYDPIFVTLENNNLYLECWTEKIQLEHYHYNTFIVKDNGHILPYGLPVNFDIDDADGSISQMRIRLNLEEGANPICFSKKTEKKEG